MSLLGRSALVASALSISACGGSVRDTGPSNGSTESSSGSSSNSNPSSPSPGNPSSETLPLPPLTIDVCNGLNYEYFRNVTFGGLLEGADYIELRDEVNEEDIRGGTGGLFPYSVRIESRGNVCQNATDPATCNQRFSDLRIRGGWIRKHSAGTYKPDSHMYIAYTRGDTIGTISTDEGLVTALQPVVSVENAALIVTLTQNHYFSCNGLQATTDGSDFLFSTLSGSACQGIRANADRIKGITGAYSSLGSVSVKPADFCP